MFFLNTCLDPPGDLIQDFPTLCGDIRTQTNVIKHDIEGENLKPLKQQVA